MSDLDPRVALATDRWMARAHDPDPVLAAFDRLEARFDRIDRISEEMLALLVRIAERVDGPGPAA